MAFQPATGCPFWLEKAKTLGFDPRKDVQTFDDLKKFPSFEDEWLRGGPVQRWIPQGLKGKPVYVFETGGTTGIPKTRMQIDDWKTDYEQFSHTLPDEHFPKGSNWLMLGPSGPRRLRLAVEHLAQYRGGISFCVDLDPRWVVKVLKRGAMKEMEAYRDHVIDQAITVLKAGHDVKCMFTTPKLLEALAMKLFEKGSSIKEAGITGIFSGGTEFTPQWYRFAMEELLKDPTTRRTAGLHDPDLREHTDGFGVQSSVRSGGQLQDHLLRAAATGGHRGGRIQRLQPGGRVWPDGPCEADHSHQRDVHPGFMERDEGERELPHAKYPWDGISGTRPFHEFAKSTTVGVY